MKNFKGMFRRLSLRFFDYQVVDELPHGLSLGYEFYAALSRRNLVKDIRTHYTGTKFNLFFCSKKFLERMTDSGYFMEANKLQVYEGTWIAVMMTTKELEEPLP